MRFAPLVLFTLLGYAAAQTPIPPTLTAPTGSVTVSEGSSSTGTSRTRTATGTRSGTSSLSGTLTASANGTATATTSSVTPTTTTYPSLGDASPCVVNCLQVSTAQAGCSTITDVNCYCNNSQFRNTLVQCTASNCPNDLSSAEQLGQQFCNIVSVNITYPPAPTSTAPTGSSAPSSTSAPNSADNLKLYTGFWGFAALLLGTAAI
ncbi:CFEM domain protein [Ceratobasidium sp. AG-Ba]|nr:CFEM domain protein [Ceratobasidium sp. AG-Ba]